MATPDARIRREPRRSWLDPLELAISMPTDLLGTAARTTGRGHSPVRWAMEPLTTVDLAGRYRAAAMFTFDVDAEAVMLTDHPEVIDYLDVIGHQRYGPQVAVPRLLRMLDRRKLRTTFFIPGWVAETWPDVARSIRDAGHEIGHHGYMHESVRGKDEATEAGYLTRGSRLSTRARLRPCGYRRRRAT